MVPIFAFAFLVLCGSWFTIEASPLTADPQCSAILGQAGASDNFAEHVAHAIHCFSVHDLKKFEPSVTENNKIPTVNRDMAASNSVLMSAPDFKSEDNSEFKSDIMKVIDAVLMHMGDPNYFRRFASTVELLAHEAHMHEHWAHVLEQYQMVNKQPPIDVEAFCKCALDVDNNGLMASLRNGALLMRDPKLTIGYDPSINFTKGDLRFYMLSQDVVYPQKLTQELFEKPEGYQLMGKEAWKLFKANYAASKTEVHDAALYLHCALKEEREAAGLSKNIH